MRTERIGSATLYLGDCLQILPDLPTDAAIVSDPPYGMDFDTDSTRFTGFRRDGLPPQGDGRKDRQIKGDHAPFNPAPWLAWKRVTLWGANHYARELPVGSTLVWLKKPPERYGTFLSDAEIGWQSWGHGVYAFHAPDSNARRRKEFEGHIMAGATAHPTQKPIALMRWCLERTGPAPTYIDPYMGSGTTGVACAQIGAPFIGCELDPEYFEIACERIEREQRQSRLIA